jgi:hypothetical protein
MAEAMDLILEYLAVMDLISSLFLSRILPLVPYDTIIQPYPTYPYPYRDLSLSLRQSLARSPSISRSIFEVISCSVSVDL